MYLCSFLPAGKFFRPPFPVAVKRKNKGDDLYFFRDGQLDRNFLCYESYRKNSFGYFPCW
jgi:hypothetical protein